MKQKIIFRKVTLLISLLISIISFCNGMVAKTNAILKTNAKELVKPTGLGTKAIHVFVWDISYNKRTYSEQTDKGFFGIKVTYNPERKLTWTNVNLTGDEMNKNFTTYGGAIEVSFNNENIHTAVTYGGITKTSTADSDSIILEKGPTNGKIIVTPTDISNNYNIRIQQRVKVPKWQFWR